MATIIIICLLAFIGYELYIYNKFQAGQANNDESTKAESPTSEQGVDNDIIGKSTFDVNAELKRMRQRKEAEERKVAIAKGEMTEDGNEIAKPVSPEDCEIEPKKVWKQVQTEELNGMFDEPEEAEQADEPLADGGTIDDIDLAFRNVRRKDLSEEEELQVVKVFKELKGTELLDAIEQQFSEVGTRIDELIEKHSTKDEPELIIPESFEDFKLSDFM